MTRDGLLELRRRTGNGNGNNARQLRQRNCIRREFRLVAVLVVLAQSDIGTDRHTECESKNGQPDNLRHAAPPKSG